MKLTGGTKRIVIMLLHGWRPHAFKKRHSIYAWMQRGTETVNVRYRHIAKAIAKLKGGPASEGY